MNAELCSRPGCAWRRSFAPVHMRLFCALLFAVARSGLGQSLSGVSWSPAIGLPQVSSYAALAVRDGTAGVSFFQSTSTPGIAPTTHFTTGASSFLRGPWLRDGGPLPPTH